MKPEADLEPFDFELYFRMAREIDEKYPELRPDAESTGIAPPGYYRGTANYHWESWPLRLGKWWSRLRTRVKAAFPVPR